MEEILFFQCVCIGGCVLLKFLLKCDICIEKYKIFHKLNHIYVTALRLKQQQQIITKTPEIHSGPLSGTTYIQEK